MSEIVSEAWIEELLTTAFGGPVPDGVAPFVDITHAASNLGGSTFGLTFALGSDEQPRVRVSRHGKDDTLVDVARSAFPASTAWLDTFDGGDILYETDGTTARWYVTGLDGGVIGKIWEGGEEGTITALEGPGAGAPDAAKAFAKAISGGLWLAIEVGGATHVTWTSEGAWSPATEAAIRTLGIGPKLKGVLAQYASQGLMVHPWYVEFRADGSTHVCAWGAYVTGAEAEAPDDLDGDALATSVAVSVPAEDRDAAVAVISTTLWPSIEALSVEASRAGLWRYLVTHLAQTVPAERGAFLARQGALHRLAVLQREAFTLAIARYLHSHPDAAPPDGMAPEILGLPIDDITAKAKAVTEEVDAIADAGHADLETAAPVFVDVDFQLDTIRDLAARAISGQFAGGAGPLHDYLLELGAVGYDDDPSLIDLEHVDLEADRDAAIEEALAMDDDDDF